MLYVADGDWAGWLFRYNHATGDWVSVRKANEDDQQKLADLIFACADGIREEGE